MRRDEESIIDMLVAAERIDEYLRGIDFDLFAANSEKQSAVLHQLMVIGEAAKRLSPDFRRDNPGIPWSGMAGMRDRLIHAYDEIDLKLVWEAVTQVLPSVVECLRGLSPEEEG